jgi:hypothetical protein
MRCYKFCIIQIDRPHWETFANIFSSKESKPTCSSPCISSAAASIMQIPDAIREAHPHSWTAAGKEKSQLQSNYLARTLSLNIQWEQWEKSEFAAARKKKCAAKSSYFYTRGAHFLLFDAVMSATWLQSKFSGCDLKLCARAEKL